MTALAYDRALATLRAARLYSHEESDHVVADCPKCGQAMRVDGRPGGTARFRCYAECSSEELAIEVDVLANELGLSVNGQPEVRLASLAEFAAQHEPSAEALLGTGDEAAFTAGGLVITYGDGGQSKTTLAIDGISHLAAGVPWLGLPVARPLRIVVVENEGPRGRFRLKLKRKLAGWDGPTFADNVLVWEEPWGAFSFADPGLRSGLARACADFRADALVIGPLVTLGPEGVGTPEEVKDFERLLAAFRREVERPILIWLAHHENKQGDVSGAWERLPDTLMHVRLEGPQRTKLHWRKVRWSSELHDAKWGLLWIVETEGFRREEAGEAGAAKREADLADALDWIADYVEQRFAETGETTVKTAAEDAYHEAHQGGRNLARDALKAEVSRLEGGESPDRLATTTGKNPRATYLIPAPHADSPLAATPSGDTGESPLRPAEARGVASPAAPRRGGGSTGGESRAGGETTPATPAEEAEAERVTAKFGEGP